MKCQCQSRATTLTRALSRCFSAVPGGRSCGRPSPVVPSQARRGPAATAEQDEMPQQQARARAVPALVVVADPARESKPAASVRYGSAARDAPLESAAALGGRAAPAEAAAAPRRLEAASAHWSAAEQAQLAARVRAALPLVAACVARPHLAAPDAAEAEHSTLLLAAAHVARPHSAAPDAAEAEHSAPGLVAARVARPHSAAPGGTEHSAALRQPEAMGR